MRTITFFNNKGGVGKTTTIVNLAAYLSKYKKKRMVILDLDPQSNSTQAIISTEFWPDFYGEEPTRKTIYDYFSHIIQGESTFEFYDTPVKAEENNFGVDLIPGHLNMSLVDDVMSQSWGSMNKPAGIKVQNWLNQLKTHLEDRFDYLFIDVGPSLGPLNRSALLNSDYFFTPMASDIFSLLGVKNISNWIKGWAREYYAAICQTFPQTPFYTPDFYEKNLINCSETQLVKFAGYSIQQYSGRKFKDGIRPTKSYERVVKEVPGEVIKYLREFANKNISDEDLMLGDIPYSYSVIPLSQINNMPIFDLTYESGVRGGQTASVESYKEYLEIIATNFLRNVGDTNE